MYNFIWQVIEWSLLLLENFEHEIFLSLKKDLMKA